MESKVVGTTAAAGRVEGRDVGSFRFLQLERVVSVVSIGCLLALVFYVYARGFISLSVDEFSKVMVAWRGLQAPRVWFSWLWLPGHFLLLAIAYIGIGDLLTASRVVSILGGVVVVFGMYRLCKQIGDSWAGGIAAALCATHPLVVWLSATGLVDILYAASFFLGLSYYVQQPRTASHLYIACALFAISCAFHYNAWVAVAPLGAVIAFDIWRRRDRLSLSLGLCMIVVVPLAWCIWNWLRDGDFFSFLHQQVEESTTTYEKWGASPPSMKSAVFWLVETTLRYNTILVALAVASVAGLLTVGKGKRVILIIWFVLLVFTGGFILLFIRGGFPTAFPDRYVLVPSLLMIALSSYALSRLVASQDHYVRVFAVLLFGATLTVNFALTRHPPLPHDRVWEAVMVADLLRKERGAGVGKVLLESKGSNAVVVQVFLNNPRMIIEDRAIERYPEQKSFLMQPKEVIGRFAQENGIDRIAVWSDRVHAHVNEFGLQSLGRAGSYTVYSLDKK